MTRVAAVDCGTNTIKLLVADLDPGTGAEHELVREMRMVRLGQDVDRTGRLADEALARTFAAVDEYAAIVAAHDVDKIRFCATSAARDASNAGVFATGVEARLGVAPEVVSGAEEAQLSYDGATRGLATMRPASRISVRSASSAGTSSKCTVTRPWTSGATTRLTPAASARAARRARRSAPVAVRFTRGPGPPAPTNSSPTGWPSGPPGSGASPVPTTSSLRSVGSGSGAWTTVTTGRGVHAATPAHRTGASQRARRDMLLTRSPRRSAARRGAPGPWPPGRRTGRGPC